MTTESLRKALDFFDAYYAMDDHHRFEHALEFEHQMKLARGALSAAPAQSQDELPPLPRPEDGAFNSFPCVFTAGQMRTYALQARAAVQSAPASVWKVSEVIDASRAAIARLRVHANPLRSATADRLEYVINNLCRLDANPKENES